ncbi:hypothetical protein [Pseudaestuariivita sp.]|uniref:hypothetical protein n=1 Tax=Pseudaestuariivita sp. TaxID=2211669 RepID=UPI0040594AF9
MFRLDIFSQKKLGTWVMRLCWALVFAVLGSALWAEDYSESRRVLAADGIPVTAGAAPGYVPDDTCELCHEGIAASYAEVGMSQSFHKPRQSRVIEALDAPPFVHAATGHHYQMRWEDGSYLFSRWREAEDGTELDRFDGRVDWVLGSGHKSRVYLIQEPNGKLLQLPIAWYSQTQSWGMPPGFEDANHSGLARPVQRQCMACHNAFAELPERGDRTGHPNLFPTDLPQGIGCQRCHGPGADHVRLSLVDRAPIAQSVAAIINPANLPEARQRDVCRACHLQPAVAIQGLPRDGHGYHAFRPGDVLTDRFLNMDLTDQTQSKAERFDINHHAYRFEQNAAAVPAHGEMLCTTCHNPHRKLPKAERAAHYRGVCVACHETDLAGVPMARAPAEHPVIAADADCTTCHMPQRRTQDVIEVSMTDHRIVRNPAPADERLAPIARHDPRVTAVDLYETPEGMSDQERAQYTLSAILIYDGARQKGAVTQLMRLIKDTQPEAYEPWLLVLKTLIKQKRYREAVVVADNTLRRAPDLPDVIANVALVRYATGQRAEGKRMLADLARARPEITTPLMNLASLLAQERRLGDAEVLVRRVLEQEPTNWNGWTMLARLESATGNQGAAIEAYFEALRIEPRAQNSGAALADLLDAAGRPEEAVRYRN